MNAKEESRYWLEQAKFQFEKASSHVQIGVDMLEISLRLLREEGSDA
jgi:hypothetical protein